MKQKDESLEPFEYGLEYDNLKEKLGDYIEKQPEIAEIIAREMDGAAYSRLKPVLEPYLMEKSLGHPMVIIGPEEHIVRVQFTPEQQEVIAEFFKQNNEYASIIRRRMTPQTLLGLAGVLKSNFPDLTLSAHSPLDNVIKHGDLYYSLRLWKSTPNISPSGHYDWGNNIKKTIAECWNSRSEINLHLNKNKLTILNPVPSDCKIAEDYKEYERYWKRRDMVPPRNSFCGRAFLYDFNVNIWTVKINPTEYYRTQWSH